MTFHLACRCSLRVRRVLAVHESWLNLISLTSSYAVRLCVCVVCVVWCVCVWCVCVWCVCVCGVCVCVVCVCGVCGVCVCVVCVCVCVVPTDMNKNVPVNICPNTNSW